jgi:Domain of unknown function (DUF4258)
MSETLAAVQALGGRGEIRVSRHGFFELAADDILLDDVVAGLHAAVVVEDYPIASRGSSVLVLRRDRENRPIHVVWGVAKGSRTPAVLITAYRPDPALWSDDFTRRKAP